MNYETRIQPDETGQGITLDANGDGAALDEAGARENRRSQNRRNMFIALAVLILGGLVAAYLLTRGEEAAPFAVAAQDDGTLPVITVAVPGSGTLQSQINATGTLAARRGIPVGVTGEGGRVTRVTVDAGDWVREGDVLAIIDRSIQSQQAEAQAAQIDAAEADASLAQGRLDRGMQLVERGFISQADIDRLTAERAAADARVRIARAQLAERRARNAQLNIVAPASGFILQRMVEPGQTVSQGSGALFMLAQGGEMELLARIGEVELGQLGVGATGIVSPVGSEQEFPCQIWQLAPVIDEQTRQGTARCALPYDPALRPGGFASITLSSGTQIATRLPESAILSDEAGSYVYIVNEDNVVERRPVELGSISDDGIVIETGLTGDEQVVLRAGGFLAEGDRVRPAREGGE